MLILFYEFLKYPFFLLGLPYPAIYMVCKKRSYFHFITGKVVLAVSMIFIVYLIYDRFQGREFINDQNGRPYPTKEIIAYHLFVILPLIVCYGGMFIYWSSIGRAKMIGSIVTVIGAILFIFTFFSASLNGAF